MLFSKDYWKKEWTAVEKKERRFIDRMSKERSSAWTEKISDKIPKNLEGTLKTAFRKAFELVFEKGTVLIEKTYDKEKQAQTFQINEYAASVRKDRKSIRAFARQAGSGRAKNLLLSGIEGAGLGILGIGIPDIPLFTAVLLKSIYEIALSYGFSYDTTEEQCFILKIIENTFLYGGQLEQADQELNLWIETKAPEREAENGEFTGDDQNYSEGFCAQNRINARKEQISRTSDVLAGAILYMKFIQGIPVAGIVGGLADTVYLKKITDYADLKYKRRFLRSRIQNGEDPS